MILEVAFGILLFIGSAIWAMVGAPPPVEAQLWQLVAYTGLAILVIGFIRDLYIVTFVRKPGDPKKRTGEKLICLESLLGGVTFASGMTLLGFGVSHVFQPTAGALGMWAGGIFVFSGLIKEVVVVFRKDPDHTQLIPW